MSDWNTSIVRAAVLLLLACLAGCKIENNINHTIRIGPDAGADAAADAADGGEQPDVMPPM